MYEGIRSPAIHAPKTMNDLVSASSRFPNAVFWAGGTYIMSRHDYYPTRESHDIISLNEIPELKRITRTDRYLEFGSMVNISQLLSVGKPVLPKLLQETLRSMATHIVRKQITIGGALCTPDLRLGISGTLAVLNAEVEIKRCDGLKTDSKWIPVGRMYDQNGALLLSKNELVTHVRVGFGDENFHIFKSAGNPLANPQETVLFSLACSYNQSVINNLRFCFVLPQGGFLMSHDIEMMVRGMMLPFSSQQVSRIIRTFIDTIASGEQGKMAGIQKERIKRFFESTLHELNTRSLTER
ncbi:MAG: FAD binding domain-containing protein [Sphaerochaetaceae bacterium]